MRNFLRRWRRSDEGAASMEYSILTALIALVVLTAISVLGVAVEGQMTYLGERVGKAL